MTHIPKAVDDVLCRETSCTVRAIPRLSGAEHVMFDSIQGAFGECNVALLLMTSVVCRLPVFLAESTTLYTICLACCNTVHKAETRVLCRGSPE